MNSPSTIAGCLGPRRRLRSHAIRDPLAREKPMTANFQPTLRLSRLAYDGKTPPRTRGSPGAWLLSLHPACYFQPRSGVGLACSLCSEARLPPSVSDYQAVHMQKKESSRFMPFQKAGMGDVLGIMFSGKFGLMYGSRRVPLAPESQEVLCRRYS